MSVVDRVLRRALFGRGAPAWQQPPGLAQEGWEPVWLAGERGAPLAGLYGGAEGPAVHGALVLAHPLVPEGKGYWFEQGHAPLLRRMGFHVLAFDFNGFGQSPASAADYPADVLTAGAWLQRRAGTRALAVVGTSVGAGWALCAMAHHGQPFRAAVLEGLFPSLEEYWGHRPWPSLLLRAARVLAPRLAQQLHPLAAGALVEGEPEVLLVYGGEDVRTPPEVGVRLREALARRAHVALWTVPGAGHAQALGAAPLDYARTVGGFLAYALALPRVEA